MIQLSLSLHFYLLYLLLYGNDKNDAMLMLLSVCKWLCSARRTKFWSKVCMKWKDVVMPKTRSLQNFGTNAEMHVQDTRPWHQWLEAVPPLHIGMHITEHHWWSCWLMEKVVTCMHESERTSLWTSAKFKHPFVEASMLYNLLFSETPTVFYGKHVNTLHHFPSLLFKRI